jgi:hypothetical protein
MPLFSPQFVLPCQPSPSAVQNESPRLHDLFPGVKTKETLENPGSLRQNSPLIAVVVSLHGQQTARVRRL